MELRDLMGSDWMNRIVCVVGVGVVVGVALFFTGLIMWATYMKDNQTSKWQETCAALGAELIDTPKFYGCVRDGEVVYPQND